MNYTILLIILNMNAKNNDSEMGTHSCDISLFSDADILHEEKKDRSPGPHPRYAFITGPLIYHRFVKIVYI